MKVTADQEKCVGAGQCVLTAPDVFDQRDEDGIVAVLNETPPDSLSAEVRQAEATCPAAAITVED